MAKQRDFVAEPGFTSGFAWAISIAPTRGHSRTIFAVPLSRSAIAWRCGSTSLGLPQGNFADEPHDRPSGLAPRSLCLPGRNTRSVTTEAGDREGMRKIDLSVIAPCFNEQENVSLLVSRLLAVFDRRLIAGEIVLVNDASTDATGPLIDSLVQRHREV